MPGPGAGMPSECLGEQDVIPALRELSDECAGEQRVIVQLFPQTSVRDMVGAVPSEDKGRFKNNF